LLSKPQKVFKITITQNCGFLQVKAGFAQFYFRNLSRFYLSKVIIIQNRNEAFSDLLILGDYMTRPTDYQVHMLRVWQTPTAKNNGSNLHVTIENTKTAVRVNFSDFESLKSYLQQQVDTPTAN